MDCFASAVQAQQLMARDRLHGNQDNTPVFQDLQIQSVARLDTGIRGERYSPSGYRFARA